MKAKSRGTLTVIASLSSTADHAPEGMKLLSIVFIKIPNAHGEIFTCRALLDTGSQTLLITENAVKKIGLEKTATYGQINGVGNGGAQTVKAKVLAKFLPYFTKDWELTAELYGLPELVCPPPQETINEALFGTIAHWLTQTSTGPQKSTNRQLAMCVVGVYEVKNGYALQSSKFGLLLSGGYTTPAGNRLMKATTCVQRYEKLDRCRVRELEEIQTNHTMTIEEQEIEQHFQTTTVRGELANIQSAFHYVLTNLLNLCLVKLNSMFF